MFVFDTDLIFSGLISWVATGKQKNETNTQGGERRGPRRGPSPTINPPYPLIHSYSAKPRSQIEKITK
jgi:hypothetical protein